MFDVRKLVLCAIACLSLTSSTRAEDPDPANYIIFSQELFLISNWATVDGKYPGSPGLGSGLMSAILMSEVAGPNGLELWFDNVSADANIYSAANAWYRVDEENLTEIGLEIVFSHVMVEDAFVHIIAVYGDLVDTGTLIIRGPQFQGIGYTQADYDAFIAAGP